MKKRLLLICAIFTIQFVFAQANWQKGYEKGFSEGYCYNDVGCVSPPAPTALQNIGDNYDNYKDGYNKGFAEGQKAKLQSTSSKQQSRKGYVTSSAEPMDYMYKVDVSKMRNVLEIVDNRITQNKKYRIALMNWVLDLKQLTSEKIFLSEMDKFYNHLNDMNPEDDLVAFSKKESELDNIKIKIKKAVSDYNSRINEVPSPNYSKSVHSQSIHTAIINAIKEKSYADAITLCNKALSNSNDNELYYYRAMSYFNVGKYSECIADLTKLIEYSSNPNHYLLRANTKLKIQDYYGAISDFDKIIELNKAPDNYDLGSIYNDKAYTFVSLNKFSEALTSANRALEIRKDKWYIWDTRGEIYYKTGYYKKCIEDMSTAISIKPDANSYYYRGLSKIKMSDTENGCKDLSKSGELGNSTAYTEIRKYCQ